MCWNRIFQGIFGLFLAFSAGEQLQCLKVHPTVDRG
jgi:hypothetical protein